MVVYEEGLGLVQDLEQNVDGYENKMISEKWGTDFLEFRDLEGLQSEGLVQLGHLHEVIYQNLDI